MAQNFLTCDRDQELLLPPSLREWLPEDHLAWFVLDAVDEIDLSAFHGAYREDGWGRAAFDPQMMVALLLYAYAVGERSSRGIERRCREDIAFRVITANQIPDHATIARFRARHAQALAGTFTQVLALCARAGLVSVGVVALDGSLLAGNASPARRAATPRSGRRSSACSRRRRMRTRPRMSSSERRAATSCRPSSWTRARAGSDCTAAGSSWSGRRPMKGRLIKRISSGERPGSESTGGGWRVRKPTPPDPAALAGRKMNTSDPDTRLMKRAGGRSVQGYNVQVVASPEQVILGARVTQSHNGASWSASQAAEELRAAGIREPIGTVLADGGYCNSPAITAVRGQGIEVLVPTQDRRRSAPRKLSPRQGEEARRIEAVLSTPEGRALYRRRQQIVEPVFAHIKFIRRSDRFLRRGLAACQAEWQLIAATHNLLKLWRAGLARAGTGIPEPLAVAS